MSPNHSRERTTDCDGAGQTPRRRTFRRLRDANFGAFAPVGVAQLVRDNTREALSPIGCGWPPTPG